jgi:hypothetical protein
MQAGEKVLCGAQNAFNEKKVPNRKIALRKRIEAETRRRASTV